MSKSSKIKVSIIIPTYNSAKTVRESIESALGQVYPLKEVLIVDDCSTDDTVKICNEYPVRVVQNIENLGIGLNLANGMHQAFGKYIVYLCSDDVFTSNLVVSDMVAIFDNNNRIGVINRYYYQFMDGHKGAVMTIREKDLFMSAICPSGMGFRTMDIIVGVNKIFVELPIIVKQYLPMFEWTTLEYDTVAVRIHPGGNTGTLSTYYTESPVQVLSDFFGRDFKYHLGLIQIKNRAPKILWKEICLTLKINPSNWRDPFFWFCAMVAVFVPGNILRPLSKFYRHRISRQNCVIINRPGGQFA